jgi:hypothetical protein
MTEERNIWNGIVAFAIALFLLNSAVFVVFGRINADEGWYLYAGRLVFAGGRPYGDFAFTQTPLLPYLYGVFEFVFSPGMYLGRVLTVAISAAAFLVSILAAVRRGGDSAGGVTALLGATFTYGIYFQSITKTYALTTLFFVLTLFALSMDSKRDRNRVLAAAFALLAVLTRLSALFFALPVLGYAFLVSGARSKMLILAFCIAALLGVAVPALADPDAAAWGLVTYHMAQWGTASPAARAMQILFFRIPELLAAYPAYFLLFGGIAVIGFRRILTLLRRSGADAAVLAGWILFAVPNLISGGFGAEYFVPFLFLAFPLAGIAVSKIVRGGRGAGRIVLQTALFSALALGILRGGYPFLENFDGRPPVERIRSVASLISETAGPGDRLFAMEALWAAVESGRTVVPGLAMAQFSFLETDSQTADRLHLVNSLRICEYFSEGIPGMILLTGGDWEMLRSSEHYGCIADSLERKYRLVATEDHIGQHASRLELYLRREA